MRNTLIKWNGAILPRGERINNLRDVDGTVIFAATNDEISTFLNRIEQEGEKLGLTINRNKTKLMIVDKANKNVRSGLLNAFKRVISFVYLGSTISRVGECEYKIKRRISLAKITMTKLTQIWKDHIQPKEQN